MDKIMKAIILARVSTENQSLYSQIEKLIDEAKRFGYDEDNTTIISGKESGVKLDIEERQTIQVLKEHIETEQYDMVFIWEVSRLARRPKVLYEVREYLIEHHVNLHCMTPQFTMLKDDFTIDPTASIVFALFGTMAEEEARLSKQRMLRGRIAKREQGKFIGGNLLFGYTYDTETDKIRINENERPTVIEIFERYTRNESIRSIAKDLMDRGQLRYDDYATACVMLRRMIKRSEYAGIKQETYDYPAIISQDLYYKVRARAESKNKYKTRVSEIYYLQGIIHLKRNGMLMSPSKHAVQYRGWDERTNSGTMINMNYIDSLALYYTKLYKQRASGPERIKMIDSILKQMMFNNQRQQNCIVEHQEVEATIERINERVVKGKMSEEQGDRLIEEQQDKLRELDDMMIKCSENTKQYESQIDALKSNSIEDIDEMNDEQKQRIIRECIKSVYVDIDGVTNHGKIIEINMIDDIKHTIHMTKKGNDFITNIVLKDNEMPLDDLQITARFIRKKKH